MPVSSSVTGCVTSIRYLRGDLGCALFCVTNFMSSRCLINLLLFIFYKARTVFSPSVTHNMGRKRMVALFLVREKRLRYKRASLLSDEFCMLGKDLAEGWALS